MKENMKRDFTLTKLYTRQEIFVEECLYQPQNPSEMLTIDVLWGTWVSL